MISTHFRRPWGVFVLAWGLLCSSLAFGQTASTQSYTSPGLARLDSLRGVGALRLHATLENLTLHVGPLRPAGSFQRTQRYRPLRDTLRVMGIPVETARFYFFRLRLHSYELVVRGQGAADVLLAMVEHEFGPGVKDGRLERYAWRTERVLMTLEQNLLTRDATLRLESIVLQRAVERGYLTELNSDGP